MSDAGDRLARSRLAIIEQVQRRERRPDKDERRRERARRDGPEANEGGAEAGERDGAHWFSGIKHMASAWWRQHPARMGVDLVTPMLSSYASRKPVQFIGIAVGIGVVIAVARPWRLITAGGLIAALLKSSQLSSVLMSAMSAADFRKDPAPYDE
ncbi:MAG: hypothetical protein ACAH21_18790 [Ramlibacter sp.]|nr:hypothetical protein [Ramlibacter sp.]